jgi:hypothetical protein
MMTVEKAKSEGCLAMDIRVLTPAEKGAHGAESQQS